MPSHVDTKSAADKKAAREGRKFKGRIYNTLQQKQAAQRASTSYAGGSGSVGTPAGATDATRGWKSVVCTYEHTQQLTSTTGGFNIRLLGDLSGHNDLTPSTAGDRKLQGVRIEVKIPFATTKFRWAAAVLSSLSAGVKDIDAITTVTGWVGGHDLAPDAWFTVPLPGDLPRIYKGPSLVPDMYMAVGTMNAAVAGSTAMLSIKVHVTYLSPDAGSVIHAL